MSAAIALRPLWLSGITECKGARKVTTDRFLRAKIALINSQPTSESFTLYISNHKKIAEFFCHEADRFSSAAFESLIVETSRPQYPRSVGWLLIRGYYAAFFSLHSLMRLHGWACTRLTPEVSTILNKEARLLFPGGERIDAGLYLARTSNNNPELTFENLGGKGASHEALWSVLFPFLAKLTDIALDNPVDEQASQQLVASVEQFRTLVSKNGGAVWLTRVRNKINYSHEYGAWHPYEGSTCDTNRIMSVLERWRCEPAEVLSTGTTDELLQFCEACAFITSLCHTTVKDLIYRSVANSPFKLSSGRLL